MQQALVARLATTTRTNFARLKVDTISSLFFAPTLLKTSTVYGCDTNYIFMHATCYVIFRFHAISIAKIEQKKN